MLLVRTGSNVTRCGLMRRIDMLSKARRIVLVVASTTMW